MSRRVAARAGSGGNGDTKLQLCRKAGSGDLLCSIGSELIMSNCIFKICEEAYLM